MKTRYRIAAWIEIDAWCVEHADDVADNYLHVANDAFRLQHPNERAGLILDEEVPYEIVAIKQ